MKKTLSLILALVMILSVTACGNKPASSNDATSSASSAAPSAATPATSAPVPAEKPTITVWTDGSQNVSDTFTALIKAYNAREDATAKIELQFILSGTGDEGLASRLAAAYKTGATGDGFDIIANNTSSLVAYVDEAGSKDLLINFDFSKLKNWDLVTMPASDLKDKVVPYRGTTVVFAYDKARVKNLPTTWEELTQWIKDNPGRFAYSSSGGAFTGFARTATYHFINDSAARISNDEKWMGQWDAGFKWLAEIHPSLYKSGGSVVYPNKNQGSLDLLINQEVDMIPAWADQVIQNVQGGVLPSTTGMMQLSDDSLSGTDVSLSICSLCQNPDACYDFIDFMISPEGQKICLETMYAIPVISADLIESDIKDLVADLKAENFSILSIGGLGDKHTERWEREILTLN